MRVAIYTCTFETYDILLAPIETTENADFIAFSNQSLPLATNWIKRDLPEAAAKFPQNQANRYCKLFFNKLLPGYDLSIYIDGNILVLKDLSELIEEFVKSDADIALFKPRDKRTVSQEIQRALDIGRILPERQGAAKKQLEKLNQTGLGDLMITVNGIIFRRHDRPNLDLLMQQWWDDINKYAMRDQFGLPGLLAESGVKVHYWSWRYSWEENDYFQVHKHRQHEPNIFKDTLYAAKVRKKYSMKAWLIYRLLKPFVKLS